jgi:hypothetical protein
MTIFDRIRDTSTTAGTALGATATFTVSGTAPSGYQTFSARFAVNDADIPVVIAHQTANEWQVCWCTYTTTNTLRVDTVIFSSNADAGVNFSAGTKDVFVSASSRAFGGIREANVWTGNNTFSANVGIGTTTPSSQLHVVSGANFQPQIIADHVAGAETGAAYFVLDRARGTPGARTAVVSGDTLGTLMGRGSDGSAQQNSAWLSFDVDGTVSAGNVPTGITLFTTPVGGASAARMHIDADGNVGIGTTSPPSPLVVNTRTGAYDAFNGGVGTISFGNGEPSGTASPAIIGVASSATALRLVGRSADGWTGGDVGFDARPSAGGDFTTLTNPAFAFTRYGTVIATILRNGNVGIGTTSPAVPLEVRAASSSQIRVFETGSSVDTRVNSIGAGGDAGVVGTYSTHPLALFVNSTERMRIHASGGISFHTTVDPGAFVTAVGATFRLNRLDTVSEGGEIQFCRASDNNVGWTIDLLGTGTGADPTTMRFIDQRTPAVRLELNPRGQLTIVNDQGPLDTHTQAVGFRGSPNNDLTGAYTIALTDAGRTIRKTDTTARTVTIPADGAAGSSTNFPIGTCIVLCNGTAASGNLSVQGAVSGPTINGFFGSRVTRTTAPYTIAPGGTATIRKAAANLWVISGSGTT